MRNFFKKQVRTFCWNYASLSSNLSFFFSKKNPGVVIIVPTIILSGLILVVSVGLSQVLIRELEFSADLLFSEKAYFAAESGVEKSLLALKGKPLNYVDTKEWSNEERASLAVGTGATYDLNIANSVEKFKFKLAGNETIKFRLGIDDSPKFESYDPLAVKNFEVTINQGDKRDLQWKIICPKGNKTISLSDRGADFSRGIYDDGSPLNTESQQDGSVEITGPKEYRRVFLGNPSIDGICFMSLTNVDDGNADSVISGIFKPTSPDTTSPATTSPAKVKITATGSSFSREKIVSFKYLQKNLDSLFDLGLYLTDEE